MLEPLHLSLVPLRVDVLTCLVIVLLMVQLVGEREGDFNDADG